MRKEKLMSQPSWMLEQGHAMFAKYALIEIGMTREEVEKIITRDGSYPGMPDNTEDDQKLRSIPNEEFSILYKQSGGSGYLKVTYKGRDPSRVMRKLQHGLY